MEATDWKTQLCPKVRSSIVDKIADTCKKLVPSSEHRTSSEFKKIAVDFEERIYSAATSRDNYLKQISKKMLIVERKFQNTESKSLGSNLSLDDIVSDPGATKTEVANSSIQISPESRGKVVNEIVDLLTEHVPFPCDHPLPEIKNIATKFEEKIYSRATSQDDYLRKVSIKMLTLQKRSQDILCTSSASQSVQSKMNMQTKHSPANQQKLLQNNPNEIASPGVQCSSSLPSARPLTNGSALAHAANVSAENFNQHIVSGTFQRSVGISMAQAVSPNISANHEKLSQPDQRQDLILHEGSCWQQLPQALMQFDTEKAGGSGQTHTEQGSLLMSQPEPTSFQPSNQPEQSVCVDSFLPLKQNLHMMGQHPLTGHQGNVSVEQQHGQMPESGNSCKQPDKVALQRRSQHSAPAFFSVHDQHTQPSQHEMQFLSHTKTANLQQSPNPSQLDVHPKLKTSEHTSKKGQANPDDAKEEVFVKVEHMKSKYFAKLSEMFKSLTSDLHCYGLFSEQQTPNQLVKLKEVRQLIGIYLFLNSPKSMMDKAYKERLGAVEHTIISLLKAFSRWRLDSSLQQGQVSSSRAMPATAGTTASGTACAGAAKARPAETQPVKR